MLKLVWQRAGLLISAVAALLIVCTSSSLLEWVAVSGNQDELVQHQYVQAEPFTGRLEISRLHIDAAIRSVGLTPEGAMDVLPGPQDVGFFSLGSRLGGEGTVVLEGHYGWKDGKPAVFDNLSVLKKGDTFSVTDAHGMKILFIVRKTASYDKDALVPEVFVSDTGSHLNLIACVGTWNAQQKTYSDRQVVFADRMP